MERALHDSLCAIKRTLESGSVVPGGGAVETALSIYLENFATTLVRFHLIHVLGQHILTLVLTNRARVNNSR